MDECMVGRHECPVYAARVLLTDGGMLCCINLALGQRLQELTAQANKVAFQFRFRPFIPSRGGTVAAGSSETQEVLSRSELDHASSCMPSSACCVDR